jgi:hypothetical protein
MTDLELLSVTKSSKADKKYAATFKMPSGRTKVTHFGAAGMTDYTLSGDKERRARYLTRHSARENWNDPTSPGALSRHLLWGNSTSLRQNIASFKRRFGL